MLLDGVSGFSAENTEIFGLSCHWGPICAGTRNHKRAILTPSWTG